MDTPVSNPVFKILLSPFLFWVRLNLSFVACAAVTSAASSDTREHFSQKNDLFCTPAMHKLQHWKLRKEKIVFRFALSI